MGVGNCNCYYLFVNKDCCQDNDFNCRGNNMSSNSSWLEAYEAQKAKALQRLEANKNGQSNVTGLSGSSGIVDTKEVSGFTRQTKVTKLLSNMKLPDPPPRKREAAAPVDNK